MLMLQAGNISPCIWVFYRLPLTSPLLDFKTYKIH